MVLILRINQTAVYFHYVQISACLNGCIRQENLKLIGCAEKRQITFEMCLAEANSYICNTLNLAIWDKNLTPNDIRKRLRRINTEEYIHLPQLIRTPTAAIISTLEHLEEKRHKISKIPHKERTYGPLFDVANKINPQRHQSKRI